MNFSVLMSVYNKEQASFLYDSLRSLLQQSLLPTEIIIVKDGPLTNELDAVIDAYVKENPSLFKIVPLEVNGGLGNALNIGLQHCTYDIVARMDSDDLCYPNRFEKQISYLKEHSDVAIVGSYLKEFDKTPNDLNTIKQVPLTQDSIYRYAKRRSPFNHPTIIFNKKTVIDSGGYRDMPLLEDYYLWLRMFKNNSKVANIGEPLLYMRIGNDMIGRRHGWSYLKKEAHFYKSCYQEQLISGKDFILAILPRIPLRLLPKSILKAIYKVFLRK